MSMEQKRFQKLSHRRFANKGLPMSFIQLLSISSSLLLSSPAPQMTAADIDYNAVGLLEVFPFKDKKKSIRCTAFHAGNGYVVTAGHCFLGALACNKAQVWFGLHNDFGTRLPSKCTEVVWNRPQERDNDIAVFKVDVAPQAAFDLAHVAIPQPAFQLSYSDAFNLLRTENCLIQQGWITDAFGRQRRPHALSTNCASGFYGHGAPLLSRSGQVIAVQQAPLFFPSPEGTNKSSLTFLSAIDEISRHILQNDFPFPNAIRIGGFAPEAFPNAIQDELALNVANIQYETSSGYLAARFSLSPNSTFVISDARGQTLTFSGLQDESMQRSIRLFPPVQIYLHTSKKTYFVNDTINLYF